MKGMIVISKQEQEQQQRTLSSGSFHKLKH